MKILYKFLFLISLFFVLNKTNAQITMTSGGNSTVSTSTTFYDPGGIGNYANSVNITHTVCPATAGQYVRVTFSAFSTENAYDYLRVYNGSVVCASTLLGSYTGSTIPAALTSSAPNGCLTFVFTSDVSTVSTGFVATVTQQTTIGGTAYSACASAPANDNCTNATTLTVNTTCSYSTSTTAAATAQLGTSGYPSPACAGSVYKEVWFSFVAPATGAVQINSNTGVITDGGMALYSGTCGALTLIECDDDDSPNGAMSYIQRPGLIPGDTYYIAFWEYGGDNDGTFSICVNSYTPPPTPPNDNCSGAVVFPTIPTNGTCATLSNQSTANATNSNVTPTGACTSNSGTPNDVWFRFVATASNIILNATWVSGETDVYWQVFSSSCASSMTSILCTDNNSGGTLTGLTVGNTYYIRMYAYFGGTTSQTICLRTPPPPPTNDECVGAIAFPTVPTNGTCSTLSNQSTTAALQSNVTPTGACASNSGTPNDVWFRFVATASNIILNATWVSGETDVYWQVFSSSCATTMTSILCTDNNSGGILTGLTIGQTYYIRMYAYFGGVTSQTICLQTPPPPPTNDDCAGAIAFPPIPNDGTCASLLNQSSQAALTSNVTPFGACVSNSGTPDDDVWFSFVATSNTVNFTATFVSNETDVYWQVFSGSCNTSMNAIVCTDNNAGSVLSGLTIGQTYYIRMYSYSSGNIYTVQSLCLTNPCPGGSPNNDLPCNAIAIPLGSIASGNNACSSNSGEPTAPSCWNNGAINTVWYSFVAPASGSVKIRTAPGTLLETQIAVYSGSCGSAMTLVNCNNDAPSCGGTSLDISELSLTGLTNGTTYYIEVDGEYDLNGTFAITVIDGNSTYPSSSGQECVAPITVCNSTISVGDPGYQGIGFTCDNTNSSTTGTNCTTGERGSAWYKIIIDNPGTLYFNIIPNDYSGIAGDETDYDFLLWKINGSGSTTCAALTTNGGANTVACNYSFLGVTGLAPSGNTPAPYSGYDGAYETGVTVAAGDIYYLAVQNFSNSASGFTLDFTNTAAGVVNYGTPASVTWTGGANTTNWNSNINWGGCTIPTCGINAIVSPSSSFQPAITSAMGTVVVRNITIDPGATLTLGANSVLRICESLFNNGTIIAHPTSTILFSDDNTTHSLNGTLSGSSQLGNLTITDIAGSSNCSVIANTNLQLAGNFTTSNPTSIFNLNNRNLTIAGNLINASGATTFTNTPNSTITFNGSTAQTYSPNQSVSTPILILNNVVMNHSGTGVSISTTNTPNMVLGTSGQLTLTLGKIITPNAQEVILTNTATNAVTTGNTSSYVEGNLRRYLAANATGSFDFPVGHSIPGYERANVNFTSSVAASPIQLVARFDPWNATWTLPGAPGWGTECSVTYNAPYLNNGYWSIDASAATTGNYTMTLYNRSYTNSKTYFSIAKSPSASAAWALNGNCVVGNPVTAVQRTSMSGFSKFSTIQHDITLPVELIEFKAEKQQETVLLTWKTATEINSDYFMIERSSDGIEFNKVIGIVDAAGFSNSIIDYKLVDELPLIGNNYYRLKQVDFDNTLFYSEIVLVNFKDVDLQSSIINNLFPNPVVDNLYFEYNSTTDESIQLKIINDLGSVLIDKKMELKSGKSLITTDLSLLSNGIYLLKVTSDKSNLNYTKKILKK